MIQEDPEVALALTMLADKLRERGKEALAFKIENLIDLLIEELQAGNKRRP